jgi:thiol:disulfide interchange protein DsbD
VPSRSAGPGGRDVEARFSIASGYYLYREKLKFAVEPATLAGSAVAARQVKEDAFFGKVEIYRGGWSCGCRSTARSRGQGHRQAESQGCADAGVCYPPQVQT